MTIISPDLPTLIYSLSGKRKDYYFSVMYGRITLELMRKPKLHLVRQPFFLLGEERKERQLDGSECMYRQVWFRGRNEFLFNGVTRK